LTFVPFFEYMYPRLGTLLLSLSERDWSFPLALSADILPISG
jgi:hypothetical protein